MNVLDAQRRSISFPDQTIELKNRFTPFLLKTIDPSLVEQIVINGTNLKTLSLEGLPVTDRDLQEILTYCPNLSSCDLSECTLLTDECLPFIPRNIEHLFIRGLPSLTEKVFDYLPYCLELRTLDLSQNNFPLNRLKTLETLNKLEILYLWQCRQLKNEDLGWMTNRQMKRVDISFCTSLTDVALSSLKKTSELSVDGINYLTPEGLKRLVESPDVKKVSACRCRLISEKDPLPIDLMNKIGFRSSL